MDLLTLFLLMLKGALVSSNGTANLPSVHQDLLARGWATDTMFANALAISQFAPGPAGLWVVALAFFVVGIPGAVLTVLAICLPPLLVLPVSLVHRRFASSPWVIGFVRGLALAASGSVPLVVLRAVGAYGFDGLAIGIMLTSAALVASRRLPVVAILLGGAVLGAIFYR